MKKILLTISIFMNIGSLQAQLQHEFVISAGGGVSALHYKSVAAGADMGIGALLGAGYVYFFAPQWGIATGMEAAFYGATAKAVNLHVEYSIATPTGLQGNFLLRADYAGFKETQRAIFLQIPAMLQFQTPLGNKFFYAAAGLKLAFPVLATYNQSSTSVTTSGYSDYTEQTYEHMSNHGFDTYRSAKSSGSLDFGMAYMLAFESGVKWRVSDKNTLYTGIYFDYGLNGISRETAQELLVYNESAPSVCKYNSFLQSYSENQSFADKVLPLAIGIKLKWSFGK